MEIIEGSIVRSIAGRDKGDLFIVLSREGDFVYLANGELRKVDHPKKKKLKHSLDLYIFLPAQKVITVRHCTIFVW